MHLNPDNDPVKDLEDAIQHQQAWLLELMENVLQLCKVCDLALSRRKQIRWDRYSRLFALVSRDRVTVDFVEEALTSGVQISRVFQIPETSDPRLQRIYHKIFSKSDRQLALLSTATTSFRVEIPMKWNRWIEPLHDRSEVFLNVPNDYKDA